MELANPDLPNLVNDSIYRIKQRKNELISWPFLPGAASTDIDEDDTVEGTVMVAGSEHEPRVVNVKMTIEQQVQISPRISQSFQTSPVGRR